VEISFAIAALAGLLALVLGYLLLREPSLPASSRDTPPLSPEPVRPAAQAPDVPDAPVRSAGLRTLTRTAASLSQGIEEASSRSRAAVIDRTEEPRPAYKGSGLWVPAPLDDLQPLLIARLKDDIGCLTKLSGSNFRISVAVANPDTDIQEVVQLVSTDPELAARILRVANSPSLGLKCQVKELSRAIVVLGYAEVKALALRTCLDGMLDTVSFRSISERLWRHSYMCSVAALNMAQTCRKVQPPLASTLGLLHDFGRLAISVLDTALFYELERGKVAEDSEMRLRREENALGICHGPLGALITRQWGLPEDLVQGINYHNLCHFTDPGAVPREFRPAVSIVHCAESLVEWVEIHRRESSVATNAAKRWSPPKDYLKVLGPSATPATLATPDLIQRILTARELAST
jgi:HD-like signal output (HDOD) protein